MRPLTVFVLFLLLLVFLLFILSLQVDGRRLLPWPMCLRVIEVHLLLYAMIKSHSYHFIFQPSLESGHKIYYDK